MMMTVHVYKILDSSLDISNPLGFVNLLMLDMSKRDLEENKGRTKKDRILFPLDYLMLYVEREYNKQCWIRSGSSQMMSRK